jgi:hypothetical protein
MNHPNTQTPTLEQTPEIKLCGTDCLCYSLDGGRSYCGRAHVLHLDGFYARFRPEDNLGEPCIFDNPEDVIEEQKRKLKKLYNLKI